MSGIEPDMEDLFQEKKRVRNPLVPLGLSSLSHLSLSLSISICEIEHFFSNPAIEGF